MIREVAELSRRGRVSRLVFDLDIAPEHWCAAMARVVTVEGSTVHTFITNQPWTVHAVVVDAQDLADQEASSEGRRRSGAS